MSRPRALAQNAEAEDKIIAGRSSSTVPPPFGHALLAGAGAGLLVDLSLYPLDTIKTRLQSARGFLASGGFRGIYRGIGSVSVGSAPGAALFFVSYETVKDLCRQVAVDSNDLGGAAHVLAASIAELCACVIRVPTEVVKSRMQAAGEGTAYSHLTVWQGVQKVHQSGHGLRPFYTGWNSTILREIPFTCVQFPLYEWSKLRATRLAGLESDRELSLAFTGLLGSLSGAFAAAITTPLDVAKTRIMLQERKSTGSTSIEFASIFSDIYRQGGVKALFAGLVPRTMWIGIGGAVFLGGYESLLRLQASR